MKRPGLLLPLILVIAGCASVKAPATLPPGQEEILQRCRAWDIPLPTGIEGPKLIRQTRPVHVSLTQPTAVACVVATIDTSGNVVEPEVAYTDSVMLARAFVDALRTWRFKPAMRNGEPVEVRSVFSIASTREGKGPGFGHRRNR